MKITNIFIVILSLSISSCSITNQAPPTPNSYPGEHYLSPENIADLQKTSFVFNKPIARDLKIHYVYNNFPGNKKLGDGTSSHYVYTDTDGWDNEKNKHLVSLAIIDKNSSTNISKHWAREAITAEKNKEYRKAEVYKRASHTITRIDHSRYALNSSNTSSQETTDVILRKRIETNVDSIKYFMKKQANAIGNSAPEGTVLYLYINHNDDINVNLSPFTIIFTDHIIATLKNKNTTNSLDEAYTWYKTEKTASSIWQPPNNYQTFNLDNKFIGCSKDVLSFGEARYECMHRYIRNSRLSELLRGFNDKR